MEINQNVTPTRNILVFNQPKQKAFSFKTSSERWEDIAKMISDEPSLEIGNISNMKAVLHSNGHTLELPHATIPQGDQKIFLFEQKIKSGATKKELQDIEKMSHLDLRRLAKKYNLSKGIGSNPTKEELIKTIEDFAGIKRSVVAKTTKTGKIRNHTVVEKADDTDAKIETFKKVINNQPTLEERVASLENFLEKFIIHVSSFRTENKPEPILIPKKEAENLDILELNKLAQSINPNLNVLTLDNEEDSDY